MIGLLSRWLAPPAAQLLERAQQRTGLSDFGEDPLRENLEALLESAERDGVLHPQGRARLHATLLVCLEQRLRFEAARSKSGAGEVLARRPLVIVGLPRSGTTLLHRLLAADPQARALPLWLGLEPWPAPTADEWAGGDPLGRRARAAAALAGTADLAPIHPMGVELAEECTHLMRTSLDTLQFSFTRPLLSYQQQWLGRDHRAAYRHLRQALAQLERGLPARHWALKSPQHLGALDALLEVFPDADVVGLHRDPVQTVGSWCSFTSALWRPHALGLDPARVGQAGLELLGGLCERGRAVRRTTGRVFDLGFDALAADPLAAAEQIYQHFGRPFDGQTRSALRRHLEEQPSGDRGRHRYALEEFGLTAAKVAARFAAYRAEQGWA